MAQGGARGAAFWAGRDVRGRWRSLVLLGVLIGLTAGFALSAWAGARRTDTALQRLRVQTNAADAVVFPSQVGITNPNWGPLAARPEVSAVAVWDLLFGNYDGHPGSLIFGSKDGTYLDKVDRPVVVQGRMFNPHASNEVVVDENAAKSFTDAAGEKVSSGDVVGSTFTYRFFGRKQSDEDNEPPRGPKVTMHVVGVVRETAEFLFVPDGQVLVSPGFLARYGSRVQGDENADVRLRHGAADMGALRHDVNKFLVRGAPVLDTHAAARRVSTTLAVETTALLLLALAILLGGGILVAQVLVRSASTVADDALVLRALGMSRNHLGLATGLAHLVPALIAGPATLGVAFVLSDRFPVGLGRQIDPDVGYHVDWTVIGPGVALVVVATLVVSVLIGRGSLRGRVVRQRPDRALGSFRRWAPAPIGLGTTMAFEPGRGRRRIPVVPALVAAVVAVTGVVASLSIDSGIANALAHPALAGVTWDASVTPSPQAQTGRNVTARLADRLVRDKAVHAAAVIDRDLINVNHVGVPTFALRPITGTSGTPISFTLTSGRAPSGLGEAAIGPATAKDLHVGIGDTVSVGRVGAPVRIVGEALFPSDVHSEFDEGLWLSPEAFDAVVPPIDSKGSLSDERVVAVRFVPGTRLQAAATHLQSELGALVEDISPPDTPQELTNLRNVRTLPDVLAAFLGFIAVAALGSVLLSCARRRGHEFSVLRAIGMTRRNVHAMLNSQGTAIGLFGLVVGVPLGLVIGRLGWRAIAERVPLSTIAPFALTAALLLIPITLVAANVLAVWPGRVTLSRAPAEKLRAE
jgi:ABC-type antimicrobial peptide transport system permease subunit